MEYQFAFEKLRVWQNSRELVGFIYKITNTFPKEERYCLVDQIRRGVISVASNLAEGSSRISSKDQAHFTNMAYSSLMEVLNQLYLSMDLGYITEDEFSKLKIKITELSNQLNSLRKSQLNK
ncbi:MAG: four helix bundle protein [Ignavibacteria bacterium]|nr:four helix bundle protein [Ignavibacteria bacterium]